ncbi:hypothetical protein GvMRE_I1g602 [endosymbiont GvMRE of Glomus versiforme]|nr:hypothetical protein GvMRE_I1g602 [endosymbiont GvMRE of Glomus versiforme]
MLKKFPVEKELNRDGNERKKHFKEIINHLIEYYEIKDKQEINELNRYYKEIERNLDYELNKQRENKTIREFFARYLDYCLNAYKEKSADVNIIIGTLKQFHNPYSSGFPADSELGHNLQEIGNQKKKEIEEIIDDYLSKNNTMKIETIININLLIPELSKKKKTPEIKKIFEEIIREICEYYSVEKKHPTKKNLNKKLDEIKKNITPENAENIVKQDLKDFFKDYLLFCQGEYKDDDSEKDKIIVENLELYQTKEEKNFVLCLS